MPIAVSGFAELESVLGHEFRDSRWLLQALTHSSRIPERTAEDSPGDNEKLEFLGDAVLELLVSEELVRTFPDWREGQLSKGRSRLVNATSLCSAAQRLDLGKHLRLSRGEEKTGGRSKSAILADAYEAVVAAIYLDAGLDAARRFVQKSLIEGALTVAADSLGRPDHKSALQELLQAHRGILYKVAKSYSREADDREDLAQEITVQLWRAFSGFDEDQGRFSTWMYRIALNVAISYYRRERTRTRYVLTDSDRLLLVSVPEQSSVELDMMYQFIDELDPLNRALVLLYLDGHTYEEMGSVLGLSPTNAATKINRLKKILREKVSPAGARNDVG